jgi:hypothetical protein
MKELLNRDEPFVIEKLLELQPDDVSECIPLNDVGSDEIQINVQSGLTAIELEKTLQTFLSVYNNLNLDECYHSQMLSLSLLGIRENNRRNLQFGVGFGSGLRVSIAAGCSARVCPQYRLGRGLASFFTLNFRRRRSLHDEKYEDENEEHEDERLYTEDKYHGVSFLEDFHRNHTDSHRHLQDATTILEECLCRVRDNSFTTVPSRLAPELDVFIDALNEELVRLNLPPILDVTNVDDGFQPTPAPPLKKRPKKFRYAKAAKVRRGWYKGKGKGNGKGKGQILRAYKPNYYSPPYNSPPRNVFFRRPP